MLGKSGDDYWRILDACIYDYVYMTMYIYIYVMYIYICIYTHIICIFWYDACWLLFFVWTPGKPQFWCFDLPFLTLNVVIDRSIRIFLDSHFFDLIVGILFGPSTIIFPTRESLIYIYKHRYTYICIPQTYTNISYIHGYLQSYTFHSYEL